MLLTVWLGHRGSVICCSNNSSESGNDSRCFNSRRRYHIHLVLCFSSSEFLFSEVRHYYRTTKTIKYVLKHVVNCEERIYTFKRRVVKSLLLELSSRQKTAVSSAHGLPFSGTPQWTGRQERQTLFFLHFPTPNSSPSPLGAVSDPQQWQWRRSCSQRKGKSRSCLSCSLTRGVFISPLDAARRGQVQMQSVDSSSKSANFVCCSSWLCNCLLSLALNTHTQTEFFLTNIFIWNERESDL
jgi:hypothetical protein